VRQDPEDRSRDSVRFVGYGARHMKESCRTVIILTEVPEGCAPRWTAGC